MLLPKPSLGSHSYHNGWVKIVYCPLKNLEIVRDSENAMFLCVLYSVHV